MARPTEPHDSQLDWQPESNTVWQNVRAAELAPIEWTDHTSDDDYIPRRAIKSDYALPSRIAELDLELTPGTLFYRLDNQYGYNLGAGTKHDDQLDPSTWAPVDDWVETWARLRSSDLAELVPLKVPVEWTTSPEEIDGAGHSYWHMRDGFMTVGELVLWRLLNVDPDPDPDPDPEPGELPAAVVSFAGLAPEPELLALAANHAQSVTLQVRGFTRGRGFTDAGEPADDIRAVIVSAAARSMANPTGMERMRLGVTDYSPGTYSGWTLAELAILHNYRKRWA